MKIISYEFMALAAAGCWALSSVTSVVPSRHLGAFGFARWRALFTSLLLWAVAYGTGGWHTLSVENSKGMILSGLVGVFMGDTALYAAMERLGPRRTGVLFATNAVFSVLLGVVVLHEKIGFQACCGIAMTSVGVMTAIFFGGRKKEKHDWEANRGSLAVGIMLGLMAAMCQVAGTFLSKPLMKSGMDPISAAAIRTGVSALAHFLILILGVRIAKTAHPLTRRIAFKTACNGLLGIGLGMTFLLIALRHGDIGIVSVLSAVTPVLILPLLWWYLKQPPAIGAWVGAVLTTLGTALILLR